MIHPKRYFVNEKMHTRSLIYIFVFKRFCLSSFAYFYIGWRTIVFSHGMEMERTIYLQEKASIAPA